MMNKYKLNTVLFVLLIMAASPVFAEQTCFESRKGSSEVTKRQITKDLPNVKCSKKTGAVLWWGDPFDGTVPFV